MNGRPQIVGVNNRGGDTPNHAVLADGWRPVTGAGTFPGDGPVSRGTYSILDPANVANTTLLHGWYRNTFYKVWDCVAIGGGGYGKSRVAEGRATGALSEAGMLRICIGGARWVMIRDPAGRRTVLNEATGEFFSESPGARGFHDGVNYDLESDGPGRAADEVVIPAAGDGEYVVDVLQDGSGIVGVGAVGNGSGGVGASDAEHLYASGDDGLECIVDFVGGAEPQVSVTANGIANVAELSVSKQLKLRVSSPALALIRAGVEVPRKGRVQMELLDVCGRRLMMLQRDNVERGYHEYVLHGNGPNGAALVEGVYFVRVRLDELSAVQKVVVLR